jgi:hypothetical protein
MSQLIAPLKGEIMETNIKIFWPDKITDRIKDVQKRRRNNGIKKVGLTDNREQDNDRTLSDVQKRKNNWE